MDEIDSCVGQSPQFMISPTFILLYAIESASFLLIQVYLYLRTPSNSPVDKYGDKPLPTQYGMRLSWLFKITFYFGFFTAFPTVAFYYFYLGLGSTSLASAGQEQACQLTNAYLGFIIALILLLLQIALVISNGWKYKLGNRIASLSTTYLTIPAENMQASGLNSASKAKIAFLGAETGMEVTPYVQLFGCNVDSQLSLKAINSEAHSGGGAPFEKSAAAKSSQRLSDIDLSPLQKSLMHSNSVQASAPSGIASPNIEVYVCDGYGTKLCPTSQELIQFNLRQEYKMLGCDLRFPGNPSGPEGTLTNVHSVFTDYVTLPFDTESIDVLVLPDGFSIKYLNIQLKVERNNTAQQSADVLAGIDPMMRRREAFMQEVYRVLKPGGRFVSFCSSMRMDDMKAAIEKPKTQSYSFGSLNPSAEHADKNELDVIAERFRINFLTGQVVGCVKRKMQTASGNRYDDKLQANAKASKYNIENISAFSPFGFLQIQGILFIILQLIFFVAYMLIGLKYSAAMEVPTWMPYQMYILSFYFGNVYIIPVLIAMNAKETLDFMREQLSTLIKAGRSPSLAHGVEHRSALCKVLGYQCLDIALAVVVYQTISFFPIFIVDAILIKAAGMTADAVVGYNIAISFGVVTFLVKVRAIS